MIYLAHKYEQRAFGLDVQKELKRRGYTVINPFDRPEQAKYDDIISRQGGVFDDASAVEIVSRDLYQIRKADAVVALLFPNAIGTVMEIFYASDRGIPVFTYVGYQLPYRHPWIVACSIYSADKLSPVLAQLDAWRASTPLRKG